MSTHTPPVTPRRRSAALPALAAVLAVGAASAGCQFGTLTGTTVTGSNVGRDLYIAGYATVPGADMEVWVLDDPTADPYTSGAHWVSIGSTTSSLTPYTDGAGVDWYAYSIYVEPVPSGAESYRWPDGGVVRLKTTQDGTSVVTFDEDWGDCFWDYYPDFTDIGVYCSSPTSPVNAVVDEDPIAANTADYLSYRATAAGEASQYYTAISAASGQPRFTFAGWKTTNGFPSGSETIAYYFNEGDLGFGRQMHCKATAYNSGYACYVTNFATVADAISNTSPAATVAMEYWPLAANNKVRFFVYDAAGNRQTSIALDSEGAKNVPGICLSCHGGTYDSVNNRVTDAKFLPFDIYSFTYSSTAGYTRADQEEAFRKLNNIVNSAAPTAGISDLISGWYHGNVAVAGTTFDDTYVPAGWSGSEKDAMVYKKVVEDYCRTCHVALETYRDWLDSTEFGSASIEYYVCDAHDMPHAERTRNKFWESPARAHLLNALKLPTTCE